MRDMGAEKCPLKALMLSGMDDFERQKVRVCESFADNQPRNDGCHAQQGEGLKSILRSVSG